MVKDLNELKNISLAAYESIEKIISLNIQHIFKSRTKNITEEIQHQIRSEITQINSLLRCKMNLIGKIDHDQEKYPKLTTFKVVKTSEI